MMAACPSSISPLDPSTPRPSRWGTEVERTVIGGHPCLTYRHRRRSAGELLLDGQRFAGRDYLVHGRRRITFSHHEQAVRAVAARLQMLGVGRGERVL
ncbi:MAG TPA: hypothetical protein VG034_16095, partial [Acidimicrobiia bacterium]|nr:hypothetical protein [Acidimicrobiia bacterium]